MVQPRDCSDPDAARDFVPEGWKARRMLRAAKWPLLVLAILLGVAYLNTATFGVRAVRAAFESDVLARTGSHVSRVEGSRAIFSNLIMCDCASQFERGCAGGSVLYLWNGWSCRWLSLESTWIT